MKAFSQLLLTIVVLVTLAISLPSFSKNKAYAAKINERFLTIKNKSGKAIKEVIAYDKDDNPLHLLSKKLKSGQAVSVKLECGDLYIKYQFNTKKACNWGEVNVCKNNVIIIKKTCFIEEEVDQGNKQ